MKKMIIALIGVCLVAAVIFGVVSMRGASQQPVPAEPEATEDPTAGWVMDEIGPIEGVTNPALEGNVSAAAAPAEEEGVAPGRVDFEAMYALHKPEEKILSIDGREESWGDYFYLLYNQCGQIENYFDAMKLYYEMDFSWNDPVEEGGQATYAETVVESAENLLKQLAALEAFAAENGVEVSEEMKAIIEKQKQEDIRAVLGEEGTPEQFFAYLSDIYLEPEMYERAVTQNVLYQECYNKLYGEKAEKVSDETALRFLNENAYVSAAHILYLLNDSESGEARDEATLAAKKAELEAMVRDVRAIADPQSRAAEFLKKAAELSEDGGKAYYPEGYTFTPGTMVAPFEEAVNALADYEISDVVETDYGYHIIMRLPLSPDAVVELNSSTSEPRTARMLAANQEYGARLQAFSDALTVEWLPGYEPPVLTDFIR